MIVMIPMIFIPLTNTIIDDIINNNDINSSVYYYHNAMQ